MMRECKPEGKSMHSTFQRFYFWRLRFLRCTSSIPEMLSEVGSLSFWISSDALKFISAVSKWVAFSEGDPNFDQVR